MARAIRQLLAVRRSLKASTVNAFLKHALPSGSEALSRLLPFAAKVRIQQQLRWLGELYECETVHVKDALDFCKVF